MKYLPVYVKKTADTTLHVSRDTCNSSVISAANGDGSNMPAMGLHWDIETNH